MSITQEMTNENPRNATNQSNEERDSDTVSSSISATYDSNRIRIPIHPSACVICRTCLYCSHVSTFLSMKRKYKSDLILTATFRIMVSKHATVLAWVFSLPVEVLVFLPTCKTPAKLTSISHVLC